MLWAKFNMGIGEHLLGLNKRGQAPIETSHPKRGQA